MYRRPSPGQLSFENFYLPFGGKLSGENRWVKLAELIPWESFESEYADQFSQTMGAPAKPFRVALGTLIIKEKLGISDAETVEQIRENPYLQYFLGFSEYRESAPFDASMLVHFRQRLNLELLAQVNDAVVDSVLASEGSPVAMSPESSPPSDDDEDEPPAPPNQGQLLIDATCAPADIRYPTDLDLLNDARKASEAILDALYAQVMLSLKCKPRTYRQKARKAYLAIAKKRQPSRKLIRKGIRQQLGYVRRNLAHIDGLITLGASLSQLSRRQYRLLLVIHEVFRQQEWMYQQSVRRVDDRIVSMSQPHVRPMVRGKAGTPVEFGAKLSLSCVRGCVFLERLSWDAFNESQHLQHQVEAFRRRFGHYPFSVHADQIYRTRANRRWCKARGIRLSGPPLGRPQQDPQVQTQLKQQACEDEKVRVQIEGKFGQAKRRFGLNRVMAKLADTAASAIAITFLVMNLERWLSHFLSFIFGVGLLVLESVMELSGLPWGFARASQRIWLWPSQMGCLYDLMHGICSIYFLSKPYLAVLFRLRIYK
ncbi:IS5-like element ISAcma17 family transposase [Acaryochloris marina]|uniref:Transposase, IS5 family, putative n=1 Tax=Acaryochloris marina (strain MBIC 11017) TaxID=329726 RepID=B0BYH3_ACAM1|nr:IS5-like element ISAcma17 family transposase [Acaryochloris marina]ABW25858.1 transposase, IS5 family, putative [Acaryochloris marina MBIC11017]